MKLNHLNLTVTDVAATREFLEKYFGLRKMGGNNNLALLFDDNGLVLTLTSMKIGQRNRSPVSGHFPHRLRPGRRGSGERDQPTLEGGWIRCSAAFADNTDPGPSTSRLPAGSRSRSSPALNDERIQ